MPSAKKRLEQQLLTDYGDLQAAHAKIREITARLRASGNESLATGVNEDSQLRLSTTATAEAFLAAKLAEAREKVVALLAADDLTVSPWTSRQWGLHELPPGEYPPDFVRIGTLQAPGLRAQLGELPALLPLRSGDNVFALFERSQANEAVDLLQSVVWRIAAFASPHRYRLVLLDSQNLGRSFASLLNLPDRLRGTRVYCQEREIQDALQAISNDIVEITQKRLRDTFASIEEYNSANPRLALPYKFIVFTAFPEGFSHDAIDQLVKIARSGRRAGVYLFGGLLLPASAQARTELLEYGSCIRLRGNRIAEWDDLQFSDSFIRLDLLPSKTLVEYITLLVDDSLKRPDDVVAFPELALSPDKWWTASSANGLRVPIGPNLAGQNAYFQLGPATEAFNALVGGRPFSGKSNFLHLLVLSLATQYSDDELDLYLVDFKEGVEFQGYADYELPHARAIVIEAEREFGLSVLEFLDAEMERRGIAFKEISAKTQTLEQYREETGNAMPRIVALFDEFVHLFDHDDRISDDSFQYLLRLVQRGRAFGIHIVLAAQRPTTLTQNLVPITSLISLRLAFKCNHTDDSTLVLGERNEQAAYLERAGLGCLTYDPNLRDGVDTVRVALVTKADRELYLSGIRRFAEQNRRGPRKPTVVFSRKEAAFWQKQPETQKLLEQTTGIPSRPEPTLWLGQPVSLSADMKIVLERQEGQNLLIVGEQEALANAVIASSLLSLALSLDPAETELVYLETSSSGDLQAFTTRLGQALLHDWQPRPGREVTDAISELIVRLENREESEDPSGNIIVFAPGLHRLKTLRIPNDEGEPIAGESLERLLKDGPRVGIHTVAWVDRLDTLRDITGGTDPVERFAHRIALHMSIDESNDVLGIADAARLGTSMTMKRFLYRNLGWPERVTEKVKPFEIPTPGQTAEMGDQLARRWGNKR